MELCAVGGYSRLEANFESVNKGRISTVCTLNMEVSVDCMVSSSRMLLYDINLMFHLIWILVSFFKGDGEWLCIQIEGVKRLSARLLGQNKIRSGKLIYLCCSYMNTHCSTFNQKYTRNVRHFYACSHLIVLCCCRIHNGYMWSHYWYQVDGQLWRCMWYFRCSIRCTYRMQLCTSWTEFTWCAVWTWPAQISQLLTTSLMRSLWCWLESCFISPYGFSSFSYLTSRSLVERLVMSSNISW